MSDPITWAALFAAGGTLIALVTLWLKIGRTLGEHDAKIGAAMTAATLASAKADLLTQTIADVRVKISDDLKEYPTHKDLAAAEVRFAQSMDNIRVELRGVNARLDRLLDRREQD